MKGQRVVPPPEALSPYAITIPTPKMRRHDRAVDAFHCHGNRSLESQRCGPIADRRGLSDGLTKCALSRSRILALGGRQVVVRAWLDASQRGAWLFAPPMA